MKKKKNEEKVSPHLKRTVLLMMQWFKDHNNKTIDKFTKYM